jgi:hypothetical protein
VKFDKEVKRGLENFTSRKFYSKEVKEAAVRNYLSQKFVKAIFEDMKFPVDLPS